MALAVIQEQNLTDIADAIRSKNGTSDTYMPSQMASAIQNIPTGGGVDHGGKYLVQVIDYDGAILKQDHLNSGATFELPDAPTNHSRLIFQEWSSADTITNNTVTVGNSDILIGAIYTTASGLSEFDISLTKITGLSVTFNMGSTSGITVDWGDGTITSDGTTTHTYTAYASYTIKCDGTSVPQYLFGQNTGLMLIKAFLAGITGPISANAFSGCACMTEISIPMNGGSFGMYAFSGCNLLQSITYPTGSSGIVDRVFSSCRSLKHIVLPVGITEVNNQGMSNCSTISKIIFPNGAHNIFASAFINNSSVMVYDFTRVVSVPTLYNSTAFSGINAQCKIIVPDSLYSTWIVASNWATYADYTYKASEV